MILGWLLFFVGSMAVQHYEWIVMELMPIHDLTQQVRGTRGIVCGRVRRQIGRLGRLESGRVHLWAKREGWWGTWNLHKGQ